MRLPSSRTGGWELGGAAVTFAVGLLTVVMPNWIEVVFGADPDGGDGVLELVIVAACALATVVLGTFGVRKRRRAVRTAQLV
jgi:hypothetical protein